MIFHRFHRSCRPGIDAAVRTCIGVSSRKEQAMASTRDLGWWYWLMTVVLLGAGLSGWLHGIYWAMALCVVQIIHVRSLTRDLTAYPVQVRVTYLAMLLVGLWGPFQWIHWMQLVGTSARVLIGYCFLARTLSLAPWNRWQPLTLALLRRTYFSLQANVQPCGEVFRQMSLERVQG
jgi:hypothetical protein